MASPRTPVYLVQLGRSALPLSLGLLHAHLRAAERDGGRDRFRFEFLVAPSADDVRRAEPGIWLFPDYIWSFDFNVAVSEAVKEADPRNVTVHGGPSAPKYPEACDRFLHASPHVDVCVRGEGEATAFDLLGHLATAAERGDDWREGLDQVQGVSYLASPGGVMVRTGDRPRIQDLDLLPSPYLDGTFDAWVQSRVRLTTVETNRGCPYGCTFCDWGSATQQKFHLFGLERVKAEIEWIARHGISVLFFADSNFGTFERDVEIAEHLARMRQEHGFPKEVIVSYAKNGNDRIPAIVRAMVSAGVVTEGVISIQTTNPDALRAVHRSNIKTRNYEKLIGVYRKEGLPVSTDLLVGLPGATVQSHKDDIQWCMDEDIVARCFPTFILPNSPMADPAYLREHQIRVRAGTIVATATASEADLSSVGDLVLIYTIAEKSTALRYVLRYLQWEYGIKASDFLYALAAAIRARPDDFPPFLRGMDRNTCLNGLMSDPPAFYDAVWRFGQETFRAPVGSDADRAVFSLNAMVVPQRGRRYPIEVRSHWNVLEYFGNSVAPRAGEKRTLERRERPETFRISDPEGFASKDFEKILIVNSALRFFELEWPLKQRAAVSMIYDEPDQARRAAELREATARRSSPVAHAAPEAEA